MTVCLRPIVAAESSLTEAEQDGLADLIEGVLRLPSAFDLVPPKELCGIEAEPDDLADLSGVAAVLARRD